MADSPTTLKAKITTAVNTAVNDPQVPAEPAAAQAIISQLALLIPQILNSTNSEPWYQSRVTWGALLSLVGIILGLLGINFDVTKQTMVAALCVPLAGAAITLYGRWKAKHPLGMTAASPTGTPSITVSTVPTSTTTTVVTTPTS